MTSFIPSDWLIWVDFIPSQITNIIVSFFPIDLLVCFGWSAVLVFQFRVLNASIKCQIWKERRDKNICLDDFRCYFSHFAFHLSFETTWKACSVIFSPLFTQGSSKKQKPFLSDRPWIFKDMNLEWIETQPRAAHGILMGKVGFKSSVKERKQKNISRDCQHPSVQLLNLFQFGQEVHQVHFLLDEVTSSLLWHDWVSMNHPPLPPHSLFLCLSLSLFSHFFFRQGPKIPLNPISGINFTYSKLIILWWIERRRRWGREGGEEDNEKSRGTWEES